VIDTGTIARRHFFDVMVLAPDSNVTPFLYDSIEKATFTADEYGAIVTAAMRHLMAKHVNVRCSAGDDLPAQVRALARWSSRSFFQRAEEPYLDGIKYSPCMCRFIQLIVGDLITGSRLHDDERILQEMVTVVHSPEFHHVTKSRCPQSVPTRRLSRAEALNWLLSREAHLSAVDLRLCPKKRQSHFQSVITSANFARLGLYHRTVYSFAQAVKFFEQDRVTLCHVYPALKGLKEYFREQERFYSDSDPEYAICCSTAASFIQQRHCKL
jgi:hypothetical protein